MIQLYQLDKSITFPSAHDALDEPNGLLAFGGDLSPERLIFAYKNGIFPWFSEDEPILWWSPDPRGLLMLEDFHVSKSLKKFIRKQPFTVTLNMAFDDVIDACAHIPRDESGTWITDEMIDAYKKLHSVGVAQSIEVWLNKQLVGGLYGVITGSVFCGESMFSIEDNASKIALYYLVEHMKNTGGAFIDCQMQTEHLKTMGCKSVARDIFISRLSSAHSRYFSAADWQPKQIVEQR